MDLYRFIALFLAVTFVMHGAAFTILGVKRHKGYYFFLSGTFALLTGLYFIRFEGWTLYLPGTDLSAASLLRIGAVLCTASYLGSIHKEEGSWLWKLKRRLTAILSGK